MNAETFQSGAAHSEDTLRPLRCATCGAAVPAASTATTRCLSCGAEVPVPREHRDAVEALRAEDEAVARANDAWRKATRFTLPSWLDRLLQIVPALIFWGGLATFAVLGVMANGADPSLPDHIGTLVFLPLELAVVVMVAVYWLRPPRRVIDQVARPFVASTPSPGGPASCRACGAPLRVPSRQAFVRCIYCRTDSLVGYSVATLDRVAKATHAAARSATEAVTQLEAAIAVASKNSFLMGLVNAIPIGMLCAWSLVPLLREYFVVNLLVITALAFEAMLVGAGALAASGPGAEGGPAGPLAAGSLFAAPVLFFAGMGAALGWVDASPHSAVLFGVIFAVPILASGVAAWRSRGGARPEA